MRMRRKIDFPLVFLYLAFFVTSICLYFLLDNGEPFPILLFYAMANAGLALFPSAIIGVLPSLLSGSWTLVVVYVLQAVLLIFGFSLRKKCNKSQSNPVFPLFALSFCLTTFVLAAPFTAYTLPLGGNFLSDPLSQKILLAAVLFLIAAIFSVAVKTLLHKFLRCKLRGDEIVFTVFSLLLVGAGICRFLSVNAYMGMAFFFLLLFSYLTKDASCLLCAFCLSLPPYLLAGQGIAIFFVYGAVVFLFVRSGRLASGCALLATFFLYGYFDGLYALPTGMLVQSVLSAVLPVLFFVLIPAPFLRNMENRILFYREKHLSRIAINRNRAAVGEKLFEISAVFREIQATFSSLGTSEAESAAKEHIRNRLFEEACKKCSQYPICARKNPLPQLSALVEVGCLKGKATLLDIPKKLTEYCGYQSDLLYVLNKHLAEYRRYVTETENTATGRALLAGQAQGVSEILKNLALEQSEPLRLYTDKERALSTALLNAGIVCSEVMVFGEEENLTVSLVTYGRADVKKIAAVASHLFQTAVIISERLALSQDKFCCILRKKPQFDAAFGVATVKKAGEVASGDTHSVIKIDEKRFMVALADGMGSGEYARKISESTVSLLESFYRAKMPPSIILSTVNKLLTFSREESFACVDVGIVDLSNGIADVVKIGSPLAFILSGNTVKVLESSSLPLGILEQLKPDVATYELAENDILLFVSDGVTDAFGSTADLYEALRSIPAHNPQQLSDSLVQSALRLYGGKAKDDMTAVAVRIFKSAA
ncbi:MAG: SpoIIE family protein phosphatase [Clostridia bacterium]|nr:SpoIIE family protein phosphatase [Clostridia bacterium]